METEGGLPGKAEGMWAAGPGGGPDQRVTRRRPGSAPQSRVRWHPGSGGTPPARCTYRGRRSGGGAGSGRRPPAPWSRAGPGPGSWCRRPPAPGAQGAAGWGRRAPARGALSRPGLCPGICGDGVVARARARAALGSPGIGLQPPGGKAGGFRARPPALLPSPEGARPGHNHRHSAPGTPSGSPALAGSRPTTSPAPETAPPLSPPQRLAPRHSLTPGGLPHTGPGRGWGQCGGTQARSPGPRDSGRRVSEGASQCQERTRASWE